MDTPVTRLALPFIKRLQSIKAEHEPDGFTWYGYDTMANVWHVEKLLDGKFEDLLRQAEGPIADIGVADGDLGFFLESLGRDVHLFDWPATNWNGMRGVRRMHELLASKARVSEVDLDSQFGLGGDRYGLVMFLGILYHLKNPMFVLEALAGRAKYMLLSTRIAARTGERGFDMQDIPLAYLVDPSECNNDSTNYWIFSKAGLERVLSRSSWAVERWMSVGCTEDSEPARLDRDERAFVLARSTRT